MQVYEGHATIPAPLRDACVAIGNFDGVHLGHQALLATARRRADELGGVAVALTFAPHPATVLTPNLAPPLILGRPRKLELLAAAGLDACVVEPFTASLAAMSAEAFIDRVLVQGLGARRICVGYDFKYGAGRGGTTSTLEAHGAAAGFGVDVLDKVLVGDEVASSTRIRGYLRGGDLDAAARLLGRPFDVDGVVVRGAARGRQLGFPTANVGPDVDVLLAPGIYACWLEDPGGARHAAVASLGRNPTFVDGGPLVLEVHVLDWSGDLYDQRVRVTFAARLRDEARFDGVDALIAQIQRDCDDARRVLAPG